MFILINICNSSTNLISNKIFSGLAILIAVILAMLNLLNLRRVSQVQSSPWSTMVTITGRDRVGEMDLCCSPAK
jgi:hypothetical protein